MKVRLIVQYKFLDCVCVFDNITSQMGALAQLLELLLYDWKVMGSSRGINLNLSADAK